MSSICDRGTAEGVAGEEVLQLHVHPRYASIVDIIQASARTDGIDVRNPGRQTVRYGKAHFDTFTPGVVISEVARTTTFALPEPSFRATTETATFVDRAFWAF